LALASAASGPRVVIRPLSHPRHEHDPAEHTYLRPPGAFLLAEFGEEHRLF